MWQKITIVGNLGSDPEMRYTPSGVPVTSFSVAVNRKVKLQDGSLQDKTTWFRVTAWRQLAETCSQYLSKGRMVPVSYTHLRAHETVLDLVCRLLLEKKK